MFLVGILIIIFLLNGLLFVFLKKLICWVFCILFKLPLLRNIKVFCCNIAKSKRMKEVSSMFNEEQTQDQQEPQEVEYVQDYVRPPEKTRNTTTFKAVAPVPRKFSTLALSLVFLICFCSVESCSVYKVIDYNNITCSGTNCLGDIAMEASFNFPGESLCLYSAYGVNYTLTLDTYYFIPDLTFLYRSADWSLSQYYNYNCLWANGCSSAYCNTMNQSGDRSMNGMLTNANLTYPGESFCTFTDAYYCPLLYSCYYSGFSFVPSTSYWVYSAKTMYSQYTITVQRNNVTMGVITNNNPSITLDGVTFSTQTVAEPTGFDYYVTYGFKSYYTDLASQVGSPNMGLFGDVQYNENLRGGVYDPSLVIQSSYYSFKQENNPGGVIASVNSNLVPFSTTSFLYQNNSVTSLNGISLSLGIFSNISLTTNLNGVCPEFSTSVTCQGYSNKTDGASLSFSAFSTCFEGVALISTDLPLNTNNIFLTVSNHPFIINFTSSEKTFTGNIQLCSGDYCSQSESVSCSLSNWNYYLAGNGNVTQNNPSIKLSSPSSNSFPSWKKDLFIFLFVLFLLIAVILLLLFLYFFFSTIFPLFIACLSSISFFTKSDVKKSV